MKMCSDVLTQNQTERSVAKAQDYMGGDTAQNKHKLGGGDTAHTFLIMEQLGWGDTAHTLLMRRTIGVGTPHNIERKT